MSCCATDAEDVQYALNCNIESLLVLMSLNMLSSLLVNCTCTEHTVSKPVSDQLICMLSNTSKSPRIYCSCVAKWNSHLVAALSLELDQQ
jgi:hypothetical protein